MELRTCNKQVGPANAARYAGQLQTIERPVAAMVATYPNETTSTRHAHRRDQFILQITGVTAMMTERGHFVLPPGHGLWIPAGVVHQSRAWGEVEAQSIYVTPDRERNASDKCRLIRASSLVEALMEEAVRMPQAYDEGGRDGKLVEFLLSEIARMPEVTLHVQMPPDPRLAEICKAVLGDPSSDLTLDDWADRCSLSRRTLTRLFRRETGQSFSAWRQRARLLEALARLGAGEAVTCVALDVGYDSPSAFAAMFKRELGAAPRHYLRWTDREIVLR
ncbi:AraC family transcriptional regulator [Bradyrhizobium sp.]|uniref:AraC family transcriptional regulator n=1 Tax=Bradyrhizobium sp. TaxID=376 RepID=UPI0039E2CD2C